MPRGLSLNNPTNLMEYAEIIWHGEIKPTADPEGRLCQFDTFTNGIRAGAINLLNYNKVDGCNTARKIITRYAPESENPTSAYLAFVCRRCAIDPDQPIDFVSDKFDLFQKFVAAIIRFEQGIEFSESQIQQGIQLAINYFLN